MRVVVFAFVVSPLCAYIAWDTDIWLLAVFWGFMPVLYVMDWMKK